MSLNTRYACLVNTRYANLFNTRYATLFNTRYATLFDTRYAFPCNARCTIPLSTQNATLFSTQYTTLFNARNTMPLNTQQVCNSSQYSVRKSISTWFVRAFSSETICTFQHASRMQTCLHLTQSCLVFRRWLRVDTRPLKNAISDLLVKWSLMYTSFLSEFFSKTLWDLHTFITGTRVQLESAVDLHGSNDMMMPAVLQCNRQIRQKRASVEVTFQPLEVRLSYFCWKDSGLMCVFDKAAQCPCLH